MAATKKSQSATMFQCGYNDTVYGLNEPNAFPADKWLAARDWATYMRDLALSLIYASTGSHDYNDGVLACCLEFLRHGSVVLLQRD